MKSSRVWLLATTAILPWGASFPVNKLLLQQIGPATVSLYRWVIASTVFVAYLIATRRHVEAWRAVRRQPAIFFALGILSLPIPYLAQNYALRLTSVINVSVLMDADPAFIVLLGVLFLRERVRWDQAIGVFVALIGTVTITVNGGSLSFASKDFLGNFLSMGAAFSWAIYTILTKVATREHDATMLTILPTLLGTLWLIPPGVAEGLPLPNNRLLWLGVLFLALWCSAWATLAWVKVLQATEASQAAPFIFLIPVIASVLSILFLNERLTTQTLVGATLILGGVFLSERNGAVQPATVEVRAPQRD